MAQPVDERRCPRCETPFAEGQEYCLECGAPLPAGTGLTAALGSAWRRRLGRYPGDWIWPALLALVVAAGAGGVSALWLTDRSSSANGTLVRTEVHLAPVRQTATAPEPTTTAATTTPATTGGTGTLPAAPGPRRLPSERLSVWPAGKSGWTIVLDSLPATSGRVGAVAEAKQALHLGLKQVGVLNSARFSSLHPGYIVVFAGVYDTQADAQSHLVDAHLKGYRGPYLRQITP